MYTCCREPVAEGVAAEAVADTLVEAAPEVDSVAVAESSGVKDAEAVEVRDTVRDTDAASLLVTVGFGLERVLLVEWL